MTFATGNSRVRTAARLLLCLAAVLAVFAMHGPSSDHSLSMPARHGASGPMDLTPGDHTMALSGAVEGARRPIALGAEPRAHGGSHAQCLATLRGSGSSSAPAPAHLGVATGPGRVGLLSACRTAPLPRGSPRPSLDRLCVSRT